MSAWTPEKCAEARRLHTVEKRTWREVCVLFCCDKSTLFEALSRDRRDRARQARDENKQRRIAEETRRTGIPPYRAKHHPVRITK